DVTPALGGVPWHKELNFMTAHRNHYPALADPDTYRRLQEVETRCSARSFHHIPAADLPACSRTIENGDLIAITTAIAGLDVVHVGLAVHQKRGLHLLHASQRAGRVLISPETLARYLRQRQSRLGIMVARVV
ncbi:MAG: N-acetylmuramoyl-L-alanine amidase-like domain-containing protein, partial [Deltaproteobacteria bacterium]